MYRRAYEHLLFDAPIIRSNEELLHDFYGSLRKLVWPVIPEEQDRKATPKHLCPISVLFDHVKSEYSEEINEMVANQPSINVGDYLDMVSLLSCNNDTNYLVRNNGDRVELKKDVFKDKVIMIFCLNVPVFRHDYRAFKVQSLATKCSELLDLGPDKYEVVIVAKMHSLANHKEFFDDFLSGFPSSCLAVPFSNSRCRDYICKYVNLVDRLIPSFAKCLVVDGCGKVLKNFYDILDFIYSVGVEALPNSKDLKRERHDKDYPHWQSSSTSTLEGLLQCQTSDVLFRKINSGGGQEMVTISKLKEKLVGVYMFDVGDLLLTLKEVDAQCKAQGLEFEVVFVYKPTQECLSPKAYGAKIDGLLQKHNISWWRVPYNHSVCCRLWALAGHFLDSLIILGPHDEFVDPYGHSVMKTYGISGYPFTEEELIKREYDKIKDVTLESLLVYGSRKYVFRHDEMVSVEELKQKNILLYFGCLKDLDLFNSLQQCYDKLKEKDSSVEVVFVRRAVGDCHENIIEDDRAARSLMNWLVCPFNPDHSSYIQEQLYSPMDNNPRDILVQFGKDGRICSIEARRRLIEHGANAFPCETNLHDQVVYRFKDIHYDLTSYYCYDR